MSFLKAEWRKLAIANYAVDPKILQPWVPVGTELDLWQDVCYVSLVGFMFLNTRLLGIKVPFHVNFEEVNLRFYVKRQEGDTLKRGVVFVREIVPKPALTFVANSVYNENYETMPMEHHWEEKEGELKVGYRWKKEDRWQEFAVTAENTPRNMSEGSETEFITEHYWGYAKAGEGKTNEYEVTHPRWQAYEVRDHTINVDFEKVYGAEFAILDGVKPVSVMLAEGSEITVENKRVL